MFQGNGLGGKGRSRVPCRSCHKTDWVDSNGKCPACAAEYAAMIEEESRMAPVWAKEQFEKNFAGSETSNGADYICTYVGHKLEGQPIPEGWAVKFIGEGHWATPYKEGDTSLDLVACAPAAQAKAELAKNRRNAWR